MTQKATWTPVITFVLIAFFIFSFAACTPTFDSSEFTPTVAPAEPVASPTTIPQSVEAHTATAIATHKAQPTSTDILPTLTSAPPTLMAIPTPTAAEPTPSPFFTAAPTPTPTLIVPTATPVPLAYLSSTFPSLVWLPRFSGTYNDPPTVLAIRNGMPAYEPSPVDIGIYWDYAKLTGRLAYASETSHASNDPNSIAVSNLWVYDYTTGQSEEWLTDNVMDAAWSPVIDPSTGQQPLVALMNYYTLVLVHGPGQTTTLIGNNVDNFAWSPDGKSIAYVSSVNDCYYLLIKDVSSGALRMGNNRAYWRATSIYSRPVWAWEHQAIFFPMSPFEIAFLDSSPVFTPMTAEGYRPEGFAGYNMLWSDENRWLLTDDFEMGVVVNIYQLSEDLRTVVRYYTIQGEQLVAWWIPGESVLLSSGTIWSLEENAPIAP